MAIKNISTPSVQKGNAQIIAWENLLNGDTGQPFESARFSDKTVQIFGTTGSGGVVTMQGSNDPRVVTDPDNAVWFTLTDAQGNNIVSGLTGEVILENPRYIRPNVTAGDGSTDLTAIVCARMEF